MNFFSIEFCIAFLIFLPFYWLTLEKKILNKAIILTFSYLLILSFSFYYLLINFLFANFLFLCKKILKKKKNKNFLIFALACLLLFLTYFKIHPNLEELFSSLSQENVFTYLLKGEILFPLGLSFYSFMGITYLVSSYKGELEKVSYLDTLLYFSFFPCVVSGPIFRAKAFFEQVNAKKEFSQPNYVLALLTLAIVKKVLISNHLSNILPSMFENPEIYYSSDLILAPFAYSFMLYCDFSGYIDLVMALALMLGFNLPPNFNKPYEARNLKEFWAKWHISLTSFIRDYLYIPLGGNKKGLVRTQINVYLAFLLSGLWHGIGWGFVIWGSLHAFGIIFLNLTEKFTFFSKDFLRRLLTFFYVSFTWIFFVMDFQGAKGYFYHIWNNDFLFNGDFLKIVFLIFLFIFLYPKFDMDKILLTFYKKFSNYEKIVIIIFFLIAVYYLMPSGMPNFIYQGF